MVCHHTLDDCHFQLVRLHALCDGLLEQHLCTLCWHYLHQYETSFRTSLAQFLMVISVKGVEELSINFYDERITNGFMSVTIGILFTITVYFLEKIRSTTLFTEGVREVLSDYAYPVSPQPHMRRPKADHPSSLRQSGGRDSATFLETYAEYTLHVCQSRDHGIQPFLGLTFG